MQSGISSGLCATKGAGPPTYFSGPTALLWESARLSTSMRCLNTCESEEGAWYPDGPIPYGDNLTSLGNREVSDCRNPSSFFLPDLDESIDGKGALPLRQNNDR